MFCIPDMGWQEIKEYCEIEESGGNLPQIAMNRLSLSAHAYDPIVKIARTIAELSESNRIHPEDLAEAIQHVSPERNF